MITNPAAQAANPEKLFNKAITTGMSAPPIGITKRIPKIKAKLINKISVSLGLIIPCTKIMLTPTSKIVKRSKPLTNC